MIKKGCIKLFNELYYIRVLVSIDVPNLYLAFIIHLSPMLECIKYKT